jgi:hypothetical protein
MQSLVVKVAPDRGAVSRPRVRSHRITANPKPSALEATPKVSAPTPKRSRPALGRL